MALLHPMHRALVALVVLLIFGPRKLPELARGVGEAMKELKQTLQGGDDALASAMRGPEHRKAGSPGAEPGAAVVPHLGARGDG